MQKEVENLEFVQGVNSGNNDSLKNNGIKYLLIFVDSCEEICNLKDFVDLATVGKHRGSMAKSILETTIFTRAN